MDNDVTGVTCRNDERSIPPLSLPSSHFIVEQKEKVIMDVEAEPLPQVDLPKPRGAIVGQDASSYRSRSVHSSKALRYGADW